MYIVTCKIHLKNLSILMNDEVSGNKLYDFESSQFSVEWYYDFSGKSTPTIIETTRITKNYRINAHTY